MEVNVPLKSYNQKYFIFNIIEEKPKWNSKIQVFFLIFFLLSPRDKYNDDKTTSCKNFAFWFKNKNLDIPPVEYHHVNKEELYYHSNKASIIGTRWGIWGLNWNKLFL